MQKISIIDIAWLAGLLEGEGCFGLSGAKGSAAVRLAMTDRDTVERAAKLLDAKVQHRVRGGHYKDVYTTAIYSNRAAGWTMTLWTFMGARRRATIEATLADWKTRRLKNPQGAGRRNPRSPAEAK